MSNPWKTSEVASCIYLARLVAEGVEVHSQAMGSELLLQMKSLEGWRSATATKNHQLEFAVFWDSLLCATIDSEHPSKALSVLESRFALDGTSSSQLEQELLLVWEAYSTAFPNLAVELPLRMRPIMEQWEARGPGLLANIQRLSGVDSGRGAGICLVAPQCGGGGIVLREPRIVVFEAVLANPVQELPEILRLAWLLCQLSEPIDGTDPLHRLRSLATTIAAADQLEMVTFNAATLDLAMQTWLAPADRVSISAQTPHRLQSWWDRFQRHEAAWTERFAASNK